MQATMPIGLNGFLMQKDETRPHLNPKIVKRFWYFYKFIK
jgi:hypothetical protein